MPREFIVDTNQSTTVNNKIKIVTIPGPLSIPSNKPYTVYVDTKK